MPVAEPSRTLLALTFVLQALRRAGGGRVPGFVLLACFWLTGCGDGPPSQPSQPPAPQLQCPANVSITGAVGSGQLVTYNAPLQVAGTTPITILCTPPSGSTFPIGTTTVQCTARDRFNQVGSCQFSVSVSSLTLKALKFLAFGDSVTAGENAVVTPGGLSTLFVDVANAYPTKLQNKLTLDFPTQTTTVVNAGKSGEPAPDGVKRLPGVLAANTPHALLLLHGYNDLHALPLGASSAAILEVSTDLVNDLEDMVRIARDRGVQYIFVSTITPGRAGSRQIPPAAIDLSNTFIRSMVLSENAFLVDSFNAFVGQEATLVSADGLHLNAAGNEVLASTFLAAIKSAAATSTGPLARLR